MIATHLKRTADRLLLPIVVAAAVALVVFFPRPEQVEAVYDRVAAWWHPRTPPTPALNLAPRMPFGPGSPAIANRWSRD